MATSFDVLTSHWIPVIDEDGQAIELGLLETLERAHELQAIRITSPLEEYSVHRFLILFLMDAFRPEDEREINALLKKGQFDTKKIQDYVAQCKREGVTFDLFDADRPFLQTPYVESWDRLEKRVSVLDYTLPNGNNHIHFNHRRYRIDYSPEEALRMLLTAQIFCTAAAAGYPSNVNGAPPWFALIHGENLFQTLLMGMIGTDSIEMPFDTPPVFWRCWDAVPSKEEINDTSWLYGMLFPARRIHLIPDKSKNLVQYVYFSQGMNYVDTGTWTDPHVTYRVTDKGRSNLKPGDDETIWKHLGKLIDGRNAPQILRQRKHLKLESEEMHVVLYGVQTNKASYLRIQRHDLYLPVQLVGNDPAEEFVNSYIALADRLGKALYISLNQKEISKEVRLGAQRQFYDACDRRIWPLLETVSQPDADLKELLRTVREAMIEEVLLQSNQVTQIQILSGRAIIEFSQRQRSILEKECRKIRKEDV